MSPLLIYKRKFDCIFPHIGYSAWGKRVNNVGTFICQECTVLLHAYRTACLHEPCFPFHNIALCVFHFEFQRANSVYAT